MTIVTVAMASHDARANRGEGSNARSGDGGGGIGKMVLGKEGSGVTFLGYKQP